MMKNLLLTNRLENNIRNDGTSYMHSLFESLGNKKDILATPSEENAIIGADVIVKARNNRDMSMLFDKGNVMCFRNKGAVGVREAANYLGIGRNLVYDLIYANELPSFKLGGRRLIPVVELNNFLEEKVNEAREMAGIGGY